MANPVDTLGDLERLFALMRSFNIGIVELPGGLKVVAAPEPIKEAPQRAPEMPAPRNIHDDPFLYADGEVPSFSG